MKDLGELKFFLGIEFARSEKGIVMSQRKYTMELIAESSLEGAKPAGTPLDLNLKLTSCEYDKWINNNAASCDKELQDHGMYQRLVEKLLYLTMTRPDISFVTQVLSQFMHCPKQSHLEAAMRVVKYTKNAPGLGLLLPAKYTNRLEAYCDSDWGACVETRRSVTGYVVKFGEALISLKSKKQNTVSRSSAEGEFRSMASCTTEVVWLIGLFKELSIQVDVPVTLSCDSKAAIQIAANPIFHERTKHIDIDCFFVRERIWQGMLETKHVSTKEHQADLLTKSFGKSQHEYLLQKLGVKNIFSPST